MKKKATRNAQGTGSMRQRADGRWECRVTVGRDAGTGKQKRKSFYASTQRELVALMKQVDADMMAGTYIEPSKMTVGQWLDIWSSEYLGNIKERSQNEYKGVIAYRLTPALGAVKLQALNTHTIQQFYNNCLKGTAERKAISPKTLKDYHGILHKALEQAVDIGYISSNPASKCKLPRIEKTEITPLDEKQIAEFLDAVKGHRFEAIYVTDLFTGMRQGEILGLSWKSVDFDKGTVTIEQQLQLVKGEYKILPTKNDKPRTISPASYVMDLLREQKHKQNLWHMRAGGAWENEWDLVFTNEIGKHLARNTVYHNFKRVVESIGFDTTRFHDLRHSYAVASLRSGDDVKTVQSNLGHHTASFTLDTYGHVTEQMRQESANRMDQFIKSVKKN